MMGALEVHFPDVTAAIDDDGRKRWRMAGGHYRELMTLAPDELAAFDLAVESLDRGGYALEVRDLRRLRDKILSLVPRNKMTRLEVDYDALLEAQGFVARPGPRPKVDEACAAAIVEAIKSCRLLDLGYRSHNESTPKTRRVAPYGVLSGMRKYLVGASHDHVGRPLRSYRLDAVISASVSDSSFTRPEDFDLQSYANRAFGVYQNDAEFGEVIWRFKPEAAEQARGYLFHPNQIVEDMSDGSVLVRFSASGHLEMCWHLYSWGDKVEVVAPEKLREMVREYQRGDFAAMP